MLYREKKCSVLPQHNQGTRQEKKIVLPAHRMHSKYKTSVWSIAGPVLFCTVWGWGWEEGKTQPADFCNLLASSVNSKQYRYNINDPCTEKHVWEGPNLLALSFWNTMKTLGLRREGKGIPEPSKTCCRQERVGATVKPDGPDCCDT